MKCFSCPTGHYEGLVHQLHLRQPNGEAVLVPNVEMLTCDTCGDECLSPESSRYIEKYLAERKQTVALSATTTDASKHDQA